MSAADPCMLNFFRKSEHVVKESFPFTEDHFENEFILLTCTDGDPTVSQI